MTTDIQKWRSEVCQLLIHKGNANAETIVQEASRIESYVFGVETKTAEIRNAGVNTYKTTKTQTVKEDTKVEEPVESETAPVEEPKAEVVEEKTVSEITEKEVKDACLAVAKKDRAALLKILGDIGASTVATIPADKYAAVIAACEKALA